MPHYFQGLEDPSVKVQLLWAEALAHFLSVSVAGQVSYSIHPSYLPLSYVLCVYIMICSFPSSVVCLFVCMYVCRRRKVKLKLFVRPEERQMKEDPVGGMATEEEEGKMDHRVEAVDNPGWIKRLRNSR